MQADLPDHPQTRLYLLSSKQHGGAGNPNARGSCQQFLNPLDSAPVQRALWEAMVQSYVPTTDSDGNEIAGIRLPDVRVPLNTYTGWALRSAANGLNDGCEGSGQRIPFPTTKAAREASGDPRLSIEERYPNTTDYYYKVTQAVNDFVAERFLLPEDASAMTNRMLNAGWATGAIKLAPEDAD
jgi:hypothetical protein